MSQNNGVPPGPGVPRLDRAAGQFFDALPAEVLFDSGGVAPVVWLSRRRTFGAAVTVAAGLVTLIMSASMSNAAESSASFWKLLLAGGVGVVAFGGLRGAQAFGLRSMLNLSRWQKVLIDRAEIGMRDWITTQVSRPPAADRLPAVDLAYHPRQPGLFIDPATSGMGEGR